MYVFEFLGEDKFLFILSLLSSSLSGFGDRGRTEVGQGKEGLSQIVFQRRQPSQQGEGVSERLWSLQTSRCLRLKVSVGEEGLPSRLENQT